MTTSLFSRPPPRDTFYQAIHYLRRTITLAEFTAATDVPIGKIPPYAQIVGGGAVTTTAFNAATTNTLNLGYAADANLGVTQDADAYATGIAVGPVAGLVAFDDLALAPATPRSTELTVTATYAQSGTAATTGQMDVIVLFVPRNPSHGGAN